MSTRTMELFRRWGLAEDVLAAALPAEENLACFVGETLTASEFARGAPVPGPFSPVFTTLCAQEVLEPILRRHVERSAPGSLQFGTEVTLVVRDGDQVIAWLVDEAGRDRSVSGRCLIGGLWWGQPGARRLRCPAGWAGHVVPQREHSVRGGPAGGRGGSVDGPLRGRTHLARTVGYVKTHHTAYLPPAQTQVVSDLASGQRSPIFGIISSWERLSWYLRLPSAGGSPWSGVVRVECSPDLPIEDAIALADVTARLLPPFASTPHKDPRAPQNLIPIGGLERQLRHRLGDAALLYRSLRAALHD